MKFIISPGWPEGQWRDLSSSSLSPLLLQRLLASSRRRSNLSFLNFLLISYLPRNRDHRIKRMSRRSPKCIGTQTECRPSFFALPPCRRTLPRPFNLKLLQSAIPSFFVFFLCSVSFTWLRYYRVAEERHFSTNVCCTLCTLCLRKKEVVRWNVESLWWNSRRL